MRGVGFVTSPPVPLSSMERGCSRPTPFRFVRRSSLAPRVEHPLSILERGTGGEVRAPEPRPPTLRPPLLAGTTPTHPPETPHAPDPLPDRRRHQPAGLRAEDHRPLLQRPGQVG